MAFTPPTLNDAANVPLYFEQLYAALVADNQTTVADIASLPATPEFKGQRIYVQDLDCIVWYDDKTAAWQGYWKSYTPTIGGTAGPTLDFKYKITPDEVVEVRVKATLTATVTTTLSATLPVPAHGDYSSTASLIPGTLMYRDTSVGGAALVQGFARYNGSDSFLFYYPTAKGTSGFITTGIDQPWVGVAWASGDTIDGGLHYRRA